MSLLPDYDDVIGWIRFGRVGRPKHRKCIRSKDRQEDQRYRKGSARFHGKSYRGSPFLSTMRLEYFPIPPWDGLQIPHQRDVLQETEARLLL